MAVHSHGSGQFHRVVFSVHKLMECATTATAECVVCLATTVYRSVDFSFNVPQVAQNVGICGEAVTICARIKSLPFSLLRARLPSVYYAVEDKPATELKIGQVESSLASTGNLDLL